MRGGEFRELRQRAGLAIRYAAAQIGISPSTIVAWEATDREISSAAADFIRAASDSRPPLHTITYALGRIMRCCADVWEQTGEALPNDLSQGFPVRPADYLGPLISRARARSPRHYREVEDEIAEYMRQIPADGVPADLTVEQQGPIWLGYYHRGADRRTIEDADREDREA